MGKEIITFGNIDVEKHKFHQHKSPISIYVVNIDRIVVSNKVLGYEDDSEKIMPFCILLPKMIACRKKIDETKKMSFWIKDDELLEKYNEIWDKARKVIKKGFDSEPVYNEKYLKFKIKSYEGKINTNFHNDKIPKEGPFSL